MSSKVYQKGDRVRVWSLQSWEGRGFIKGELATVTQKQIGSSILVRFDKDKYNPPPEHATYEVYAEQVKPVDPNEHVFLISDREGICTVCDTLKQANNVVARHLELNYAADEIKIKKVLRSEYENKLHSEN